MDDVTCNKFFKDFGQINKHYGRWKLKDHILPKVG